MKTRKLFLSVSEVVSAVKVNNMYLPLAEYVVNGYAYQVRVPYDIEVAYVYGRISNKSD